MPNRTDLEDLTDTTQEDPDFKPARRVFWVLGAVVSVGIAALVLAASLFISREPDLESPYAVEDAAIMCPMDTRQCPDGSWVSRQVPNCDFSRCPEPALPAR